MTHLKLTHLFVPQDLSFELKELGFDEPCFAFYIETKELVYASCSIEDNLYPNNSYLLSDWISAPTFSQAFNWFRTKYNLHGLVDIIYVNPSHWYYRVERLYTKDDYDYLYHSEDDQLEFETYEEAELECLRKLIEIIKNDKVSL